MTSNRIGASIFACIAASLLAGVALLAESRPAKLVVMPAGHSGAVTHFAWSPDEKMIATASEDHTVRIWRVRDSRLLRTFKGHKNHTNWVAWRPDGKVIASAGRRTVKLWRVGDGRLLRSFNVNATNSVDKVAWSPDGKYIMFKGWYSGVLRASDGRILYRLKKPAGILFWNPVGDSIAEVTFARTKSNPGGVGIIRFLRAPDFKVIRVINDGFWGGWSPDGKKFALVRGEGRPRKGVTIEIRRTHDGRSIGRFRAGDTGLYYMAWRPDGKAIAWSPGKQFIQINRIRDGRVMRKIPVRGFLERWKSLESRLLWKPDGSAIVTNSNYHAVIRNTSGHGKPRKLTGHGDTIRAIAWSPSGRMLATGGGDYRIILWRARDGARVRSLEGHFHRQSNPRWSGTSLATKSTPTVDLLSVHLWHFDENKLVNFMDSTYAGAAAWSPDGRSYATAALYGNEIKIWDARSGRVRKVFKHPKRATTRLAWSPDGKLIASNGAEGWYQRPDDPDGKRFPRPLPVLELWRIRDGQVIHRVKDAKTVSEVHWSPDGGTLLSFRGDETIRLRRSRDMKLLTTFKEARNVSFDPRGRYVGYLFGKKNPVLRIHRARDGALIRTFRNFPRDIGWFSWHPSGEYLALGYGHSKYVKNSKGKWVIVPTTPNRIEIRSADDGRLVRVFRGHSDGVWSPDGSVLYTTGNEKLKAYRWREGKLLYEVAMPRSFGLRIRPDGKFMASTTNNGLIYIRETRTGKLRAILRMFSDGIGVITTPDGRFDYTRPDGGKYIQFRVDGKLAKSAELERLRKRFRVPGLMKELLK